MVISSMACHKIFAAESRKKKDAGYIIFTTIYPNDILRTNGGFHGFPDMGVPIEWIVCSGTSY